jgi:hypothetical protein
MKKRMKVQVTKNAAKSSRRKKLFLSPSGVLCPGVDFTNLPPEKILEIWGKFY